MGQQRSEERMALEKKILKLQIKNEMVQELDSIIYKRIKVLVGPFVAESIGAILNFPLNVKQIASLSGKTEASIYKMCQRGQIPHTKVGTRIYINLKDVNNQLLRVQAPEEVAL